ncbi:MAG: hypothetical protein ABIL58_23220 [Pseudomonadota bacterium]
MSDHYFRHQDGNEFVMTCAGGSIANIHPAGWFPDGHRVRFKFNSLPGNAVVFDPAGANIIVPMRDALLQAGEFLYSQSGGWAYIGARSPVFFGSGYVSNGSFETGTLEKWGIDGADTVVVGSYSSFGIGNPPAVNVARISNVGGAYAGIRPLNNYTNKTEANRMARLTFWMYRPAATPVENAPFISVPTSTGVGAIEDYLNNVLDSYPLTVADAWAPINIELQGINDFTLYGGDYDGDVYYATAFSLFTY